MSDNVFVKSTGGQIVKGLLDLPNRIVSGYYTSDNVDLYGHIIDPQGMIAALEDYRRWGTIREMHNMPVGVTEKIGTPEWNFIAARVSRSARGDEVLQLVNEGVYGAFSVGILVTKAELVPVHNIPLEKFESIPDNIRRVIFEIGEIYYIREMFLAEVSIVDRPANPDARILNAIKTFTGVESLTSFPAVYDTEHNRHIPEHVFSSLRARMLVDAVVKEVLDELKEQGGDRMPKVRKNINREDHFDASVDVTTENKSLNEEEGTPEAIVENCEAVERTNEVSAEKQTELNKEVETIHVEEPNVLSEASVSEKNTETLGPDSSEIEKYSPDDFSVFVETQDLIKQALRDIENKFTEIHVALSVLNDALHKMLETKEAKEDFDQTVEQVANVEEIASKAALQAVELMAEKYGLNVQRKVSVAKIEENHEKQEINIKSMTTQQLARFLAEAAALNVS